MNRSELIQKIFDAKAAGIEDIRVQVGDKIYSVPTKTKGEPTTTLSTVMDEEMEGEIIL